MTSGPLRGVRVVELAGLGPGPLAAMILAGLGATVLRVDRTSRVEPRHEVGYDLVNRGRPCVAVDLKHPAGSALVRRLTGRADIFLEGFRPGVAERLGLGPEVLLADNPGLVYGRMTGWGQDGPLANAVGHDINYIALTGALHAVGQADSGPVPPLNLVGDFGGGAMVLIAGVLAALHERAGSGRGQVVDAAMIDGAALLMTMIYDMANAGAWEDEREANLLDGGAPFYATYECADGRWIAVGAIESQFFAQFERLLGAGSLIPQWDRARWPQMRKTIAERIRCRTRDEWCATFEGSDACVSPVLAIGEVAEHPHIAARGSVARRADHTVETSVAPRFSRSSTAAMRRAAFPGEDTRSALADWGLTAQEIGELEASGAITQL